MLNEILAIAICIIFYYVGVNVEKNRQFRLNVVSDDKIIETITEDETVSIKTRIKIVKILIERINKI